MISIFIKKDKKQFYPCLKLSVFGADHPQILECNKAHKSKEDALEEASRMLCEIIKDNSGIKDLITIEVIDENQSYQQYAEDGSFLN